MDCTVLSKSYFPRIAVIGGILLLGISTITGSGGNGGDGAAPSAPILEDISLADNEAAAGLTINVDGTLSFYDANGDMGGGSFNYDYEGLEVNIPLPDSLNGIIAATVGFSFIAQLSDTVGDIVVPCWLTDRAGHRSNTFELNFHQVWTRQYGTADDDKGYAIAKDNNNNVIITGTTAGDLDGETNSGGLDVFVTKYSPDAIKQWTRVYGSSTDDYATGIATDSSGNIYVTGYTLGATFDGQTAPGVAPDAFVTKFDSSGTRLWSKLIGSAGLDKAHGIAVDTTNNIYIAGETSGDLYDTNAGQTDVFIVAYSSNSNTEPPAEPPLWSVQRGTTGSESANSIALDDTSGIFIAGGTEGVLGDEDPTPGDPGVNLDAFVAKYDLSGTRLWTRQIGTSCSEWAEAVSGSGGNAYFTGTIYTEADPACTIATDDPALGLYDAFLAGVNSSGAVQFTRQFGTANHDHGVAVGADSSSNIYVAGFTNSVYQTDHGDIMLFKFDNLGSHLWNIQEGDSAGQADNAFGLMLDTNDLVYITGFTEGVFDGHSNNGAADIYIMRYDPDSIKR